MKEAVGSGEGTRTRVAAAAEEVRPPEYPRYYAGLYSRSGGENYGLSLADFAGILQEVSSHYLAPDAAEASHAELHESLRVEELALARACARGNEAAWECFLNRYRQKLYDAAAAIAKEESAARDLADSLYTDLYGTRQGADGQRISKLASYTGRGSLEGWLRTVLAQEYINRYRSQRRLASFEERTESGQQFAAKDETAKMAVDPRLEQATDAALLELSSEERWLLASWYLDGRTLAGMARMLGVHESTVSRRMEKITASLRKRIMRGLRQRGMDATAAGEAMEADVRDLSLDVRGRLMQEKNG